MRRVFLVLFLFAIGFSLPLIAEDITMAIFEGGSPMQFTDDYGEAAGFFPDLARILFPEPDRLQIITGLTFEEAYDKVRTGEIDFMPILIKTPARETELSFNREVIFVSWSEVFIRSDSQMTSMFDLQGCPVALMLGGETGQAFLRLMNDFNIPFEPVYYKDYSSMAEAVLEGVVDAMVSFNTYALTDARVKPTGIVFAPAQAFFATARDGRVDLLEMIDKKLAVLKNDPDSAYYRALDRWMHTEVREKTPDWVRPSAFAALLLLVMGLLILVLQRRHLLKVESLIARQRKIIQTSERRYELLVENSNDLIWMEDREGRLTFLNGRTVSLLGIPRAELLGGSLNPLIVEQDRQGIREIRDRAFAGEPVLYELHVRQPSGEIRTLSVTTAPVVDEGRIEGAASFGRDITEQKNLEKQILRSQRLETLGSLTSGIAHDFNNLLTPIIGYGEILRMKTGEDDERSPMVTHIIDAGARARELIGKLMAFSRKQEMKYENICLNRLVENFLPLLERSLPGAIVLKTGLDPDLPLVYADRGQLEQVLLNLVINARDAIKGEGTIAVSTSITSSMETAVPGRSSSRSGRCCVLQVEDSGCGISEENIEKIFDPFFSTKGDDGTGLGLSTSYGIIKQHGGYIFASSRPGEGTVFSIYLPPVSGSLSEGVTERKAPGV